MWFDPEPDTIRVVVIGILIFLEALLLNMYAVLSQGRWFTQIELACFLTVATLQLITYFLGFLRRGEEAE